MLAGPAVLVPDLAKKIAGQTQLEAYCSVVGYQAPEALQPAWAAAVIFAAAVAAGRVLTVVVEMLVTATAVAVGKTDFVVPGLLDAAIAAEVAGLVVQRIAAAAAEAELVARLPMSSGSDERVPPEHWTVEELFPVATFPSHLPPELVADDQQTPVGTAELLVAAVLD